MNILQTTDLKKYYGKDEAVVKALEGVSSAPYKWYKSPLDCQE